MLRKCLFRSVFIANFVFPFFTVQSAWAEPVPIADLVKKVNLGAIALIEKATKKEADLIVLIDLVAKRVKAVDGLESLLHELKALLDDSTTIVEHGKELSAASTSFIEKAMRPLLNIAMNQPAVPSSVETALELGNYSLKLADKICDRHIILAENTHKLLSAGASQVADLSELIRNITQGSSI